MKKKRSILLITIFSMATLNAYGSEAFKLRRTLIDKNAVSKPSQFQITWPHDEKATYSVDAGLSATLYTTLRGDTVWETVAGVEYHRNTLISKEQNTFIGSLSVLGVIGDITKIDTVWLPQLAVKYKNDEENNKKSVVSTADMSLTSKALVIGEVTGSDDIGFLWQPKVGFEYENIFDASSGSKKGNILRGRGGLEIAVYPARKSLDQKLELAASYEYWNDLASASGLSNGDPVHTLFRCSAKYYLNDEKNYAIALEHIDGENPSEDLEKQRYNQLAFLVKF